MNEEIKKSLAQISADHGVVIPYAVESGSRAWGFASTDSDWDIRFIYVRPLSWYLSVFERRDVIEPKYPHPLDFSGWDLKKALFQLWRGNPSFFEWVFSPIVYHADSDFHDQLMSLVKKYFNSRSAIYHYTHTADGNYRGYLRGDQVRLKKYMYVVRPLLACHWISQRNSMPPVLFDELISEISPSLEGFPLEEILSLVNDKKAGVELGLGPRRDSINKWIEQNLSLMGEIARTTARVAIAPDDLDEFFFHEVLKR